MGVTVHFFAFDPRVYGPAPYIARLRDEGDLTDALEVTPAARGRLRAVHSALGDNKRWYDNLVGDSAWRHARAWVPEPDRAALDAWLSHLFYQGGRGARCGCGLGTERVADAEEVYSPALLQHLVDTEVGFWGCAEAIEAAFSDSPPTAPWPRGEPGFSAQGLELLRDRWAALFRHARAAGPGWGLLRWVWV